MKDIKKSLLLAICALIGGVASYTALAAEDFSFDLDAAINDVNGGSDSKSNADGENSNSSGGKAIYPTVDAQSYLNSTNMMYYNPALVESLIEKYKEKNYVGCIQEAQSKMQQDNPNPVAMYYMALSYTQIGDVKAALEIYDEILKLKPSATLTECAIRGRDCLIGGPSCPNTGVEGTEIDAQVKEYKENSTLINNSSVEVTVPIAQILNEEEIRTLPDMLVKTEPPAAEQLEQSEVREENVAQQPQVEPAQDKAPNNDEVAQAIKTLQSAGIAVTLQPVSMSAAQNFNSEMTQMSMLLGNNSQNRSFDMLPYMMMQSQNNPSQYNPQMLQAMMMNYMMPSLDFNSDNNK